MKGNGPTIQMANDHFNRLTCLIASEILSTKSTNKRKKARAHLISHFIDTAEVWHERAGGEMGRGSKDDGRRVIPRIE